MFTLKANQFLLEKLEGRWLWFLGTPRCQWCGDLHDRRLEVSLCKECKQVLCDDCRPKDENRCPDCNVTVDDDSFPPW